MLNTEWSEVELIHLQNDLRSGLGFGLLGNKTTGVLVKNIVPGGNADLRLNLRPGDLILRIGDVSTRGLGPEQVAHLLRQSIVANCAFAGVPTDTTSNNSATSTATTNMSSVLPISLLVSRPAQGSPAALDLAFNKQNQRIEANQPIGSLCIVPTKTIDESLDRLAELMLTTAMPNAPDDILKKTDSPPQVGGSAETTIISPALSVEGTAGEEEPPKEDCVIFSVLLRKPHGTHNCSLGLTIVGYVSENDEDKSVTGIYVEAVLPHGLASASGKIKRHDQIIKVNGIDLRPLSNKAASNLLKTAGPTVHLTFLRYTSGRVCEQLKNLDSSSVQHLRIRRVCATLPSGFPRRSHRHGLRRKFTTAGFKSDRASFGLSETVEPFHVCPAQSELLVTPQVNTENFRNCTGPLTCQSLPMLPTVNLIELESTIPSPLSILNNENTEDPIRTSLLPGFEDQQAASSSAASMTLDETSEVEISSDTGSPVLTKLSIGLLELTQLRFAVHYAGRITPELVKVMADVWTPIIGPGKDILVIRVIRPKNMRQLGISLIGSTSETGPLASSSGQGLQQESEGEEARTSTDRLSELAPSRHFVHKVLPDGLFSSLNCLEPGDELLQANGYRLHSYSHVEVVRCLRSLPVHIELVIARAPPDSAGRNGIGSDGSSTLDGDGVNNSATTLNVAASEIGSVATGVDDSDGSWIGPSTITLPTHSSDSKISEWIRSSQSDVRPSGFNLSFDKESTLLSPSPTTTPSTMGSGSGAFLSAYASSNDENVLFKPTWSTAPLIVMLLRDKPGFGFSISVYNQSLVDGGSATVKRSSTMKPTSSLSRRRTVPGDMNHPDGSRQFATISRSSSLSTDTGTRRGSFLIIKSIVPGSCVELDGRIGVGDRLLFVNDRKLTRATLGEAANVLHNAPLGYTMIGVAKMNLVPHPPLPSIVSSPQFTGFAPNSNKSAVLQEEEEFVKEHAKDHPLDYYTPLALDEEEAPYHAAALVVPEMNPADEKVVRVTTGSLPLGCELDALAAGGVDGCRVKKVLRGGAVEKSAALVPDDYITRINSENLRRVTNSEAFRVLRRASVECNIIEIGYYPREQVIMHRLKHIESDLPSANATDDKFSRVNGLRAPGGLIEDPPPSDLIITAEPLEQLFSRDLPQKSRWSQTRELKLLKQPDEDTWGLCITGPELWEKRESSSIIALLPPEVSLPVFVSGVIPNSSADRCGLLKPGDLIIGVNGMDATRVGCRTVAEWIQTANLVSSPSSISLENHESMKNAEWTFLYLLVLPLHSFDASSLSSLACSKPVIDLQSIPPVTLTADSSVPSGKQDRGSHLQGFTFKTATFVRSAFVSSNDSSSMEEPTSVTSLEQHGDLPEPLSVSNLAISPPKSSSQIPNLPPPQQPVPTLPLNSGEEAPNDYPPPPSPLLSRIPIPSVQTIESQSAWRNIGSSHLTASLAQLTQTYRRQSLVDDEIHVVSITLTCSTSKSGEEGGAGNEANEELSVDCEMGLGIRLVGHRDTNSRGVFICSLREGSLADRTPGLQVTDEIVQVNNVCVMGLTHVSAKLLIAKEVEVVRRGGDDSGNGSKLFLVIRHNIVYNASIMAKPAAGTAPTGCGHFLHYPALCTASQKTCMPRATSLSSQSVKYDFLDVTIERNAQDGLGLFLINMSPSGDLGVFVQSGLPTSPVILSGQVRSWDRIVAINGEAVKEYDAALTKLTTCHPSVHLRLARARSSAGHEISKLGEAICLNPTAIDLPRSFSPNASPTPILPGVETTVEIIRSSDDLGFSIIGGSNTRIGGIFIDKIHNNGTIHLDGRLIAGDQILAVDDIDLRNTTHAAATQALRETKKRLLLTVLRGGATNILSSSEIMQTYDVSLQKPPGRTFGLVLDDYPCGGVVIVAIASGSPASRATILHVGDIILEVDGLDVHKASAQDVMALLKQSSNRIILKTGRPRPLNAEPIPRLRLFTVLLTPLPSTLSRKKVTDTSAFSSVLDVSKQSVSGTSLASNSTIFGVALRPAMSNEVMYAPGKLIVESMDPESAATRSGMLQVGDRLLGVDREPVGWLSLDDLQLFARSFESLTFEFGRLPPLSPPSSPILQTSADANIMPSPQPILYSGYLAPVREDEEAIMAALKEPISVAVEDSIVPEKQKTSSPIKPSPTGFQAIEDADSEYDDDDTCSNVRIRQIQLPPPAISSDLRLGLTLRSARGACGGQRVVKLDPSSPAAMSGLQVGDRIIGLDDRLLFALGKDSQDSASVTHAIDSAWRLRHPPSDLAPLTLTIVRSTPLPAPTCPPQTIAPRSHFPAFRNVVGAGAVGIGLLAGHQNLGNLPVCHRHQDVGGNQNAPLQASRTSFYVPGVAAGLVAGVNRSGVDYHPRHPRYNNGAIIEDPTLVVANGMGVGMYDDAAEDFFDNIDNNKKEVVDSHDEGSGNDESADADFAKPVNLDDASQDNISDDPEYFYEIPMNGFDGADQDGHGDTECFSEGPVDVIYQPDSVEFGTD